MYNKPFLLGTLSAVLMAGTLTACSSSASTAETAADLTQFVDPIIGSGGHGHVFVGANVPFGAVQLGPTNISEGWDWCSGYHASDTTVIGFAHTHLSGTGIGDKGDVLFMPITGSVSTPVKAANYLSTYTHANETAQAGYYKTHLDRYGIDASQQRPKTLAELPTVDFVVTMGCGVACPALPARHREDWGLEDPTGKGDAAFLATIDTIIERMLDLRERIETGAIEGSPELVRRRAARRLKALADPTRLHVMQLLAQHEELCACKLLPHLGIGQPTLSHHMRLLCEEGLVIPRKDGRWMHYRLSRCALDTVRETLNLRPESPC